MGGSFDCCLPAASNTSCESVVEICTQPPRESYHIQYQVLYQVSRIYHVPDTTQLAVRCLVYMDQVIGRDYCTAKPLYVSRGQRSCSNGIYMELGFELFRSAGVMNVAVWYCSINNSIV